jgi:hypothetical protein
MCQGQLPVVAWQALSTTQEGLAPTLVQFCEKLGLAARGAASGNLRLLMGKTLNPHFV